MFFDIEAFGLSKYPLLEAFLSAPPHSLTFEEASVALISSDGHKKHYPYPLILHVNRHKLTVYEICAALDKWEHLKLLLDREDACEMYLDRVAKNADLQDRKKHLVFDLIAHAIVNRRLAMIDKLFAYIDSDGKGKDLYKNVNYFARLAVLTGRVDVFNRLLQYIGPKLDVDFANFFLFQLITLGYGEITSGHIAILKRLRTVEVIKKAPLETFLRLAVNHRQATILNYLLHCLSREQWSIIPDLMKIAAEIHAEGIFILLVRFALTQDIGIKDKGLLMFALREHCVPMFEKLLLFLPVKLVLLSDNNHWEMMCLAVKKDDPVILQCLLNIPNKLANLTQENNRLLIIAVQTGRLEVVKRLLQIKEIRNGPIYEAMLLAVRNDRLDILTCFCVLHPGTKWQNLYPLLEAAVEFGRESILKKLLEMADAQDSRQYDNFLLQPALWKGCHPLPVLSPLSHQFFRPAREEYDSDEPLDLTDMIIARAGWEVL